MSTRDTAWPAGTPCWIDYGAADVEAAKSFYADLMGWSYTGGEAEYGGYLNCLVRGEAAAGMGPLMDPAASPSWTTYFAVDDADAAVGRIGEAGGTVVMEPMAVGPLGRMVVALDPQGNTFGLWESGVHTGARIVNEPGALVWNEAAVDDVSAAQTFYRAVFGFHFDELEGGDGYVTFATAERPLGGIGPRSGELPKGWTCCFSVDSADETVATLAGAGGKVLMGPEDSEFGRFAVVEDPWGAPFSLMETVPE